MLAFAIRILEGMFASGVIGCVVVLVLTGILVRGTVSPLQPPRAIGFGHTHGDLYDLLAALFPKIEQVR
jgi:hypothetical protein